MPLSLYYLYMLPPAKPVIDFNNSKTDLSFAPPIEKSNSKKGQK